MNKNGDDNSKVILVTGATSGIGRGMAKYFAERGWRVAIFGRNEEALKSTQEEIGERCLPLRVDVSKRDQVFDGVAKIIGQWGRLDAAVNNAGTTSRIYTTMPIDEAEQLFRTTIETHLMGAFYVMMACVPHLPRPGGRLINISSIGSFNGGRMGGSMAYGAAKAGLNNITRSWARELSPSGITVNAIAPGFIDSAITRSWSPERLKVTTSEILVGRVGQPEDIAAAAYFLCSDEASFITGEVLNVNGGALFA